MSERDYCSCCGKPVYRGTYYDTAEGKLCFPCKLFKVEAQRDALRLALIRIKNRDYPDAFFPGAAERFAKAAIEAANGSQMVQSAQQKGGSHE